MRNLVRRPSFRPGLLTLFVLLAFGPAIAAPEETAKIDLKLVKYDELQAAIKAHKGKVVVVDFWADY